jgi:hypothetical protein
MKNLENNFLEMCQEVEKSTFLANFRVLDLNMLLLEMADKITCRK